MHSNTHRSSESNDESISVRGARVHNLKNIAVDIPRDCIAVITGPSGSGKSSLAFDTIYAEGQRRYVESLSTYARQFIDQLDRADVDSIEGLSPTISIEQKTRSFNPRSTVGTVTEITDFLRVLFARIGKPSCWKCGRKIDSQSPQQIIDHILELPQGTKLSLLAPIVRGRKGEHEKELLRLRQNGFSRVRIDGETYDLSETSPLDRNKKHDIEVYVDRIVVKDDRAALESRLSESVEVALRTGSGFVLLVISGNGTSREELISQKFSCTHCNISYPEPEPRSFSFNSPAGACDRCNGLGVEPSQIDVDELVSPRTETYLSKSCFDCDGSRLRKESLSYFISGKSIGDLSSMSIEQLERFFEKISLSDREQLIAGRIIREIKERLQFLLRVGIGYLELARAAQTLSGGESQRIRLATQIGSSLSGVIYVLDEPSIGLHPRDHDRLLGTLKTLRDLGNTILIVEHDRETIEQADWVVDLGPAAGRLGGEVVSVGTLPAILKSKASLTGQYLRGEKSIALPRIRRPRSKDRSIRIEGVDLNNLKKVSVDFPLGVLTCVTGVSGSGKSTLVIDTLYRALLKHLYGSEVGDLSMKSIKGLEHIDKVIDIDQSPIGRTPRSNPATYTDLFGPIRDIFASLPESLIRGYKSGQFSFNVKGGRCADCEGGGMKKLEMVFMADVYVQCPTCRGTRYNNETLEITYKGKNIADVLAMTAAEAYEFFDAIPSIKAKLKTLNDVGLGYIHLGQSATTLSGGEAQRMKLSKELARRGTGRTIYILDEPSTGLHFDDIRKLVDILQSLVDQGNTVIVIEHNLDIIKVADHIIDMGPEGGEGGGQVLAQGTPEEVALVKGSFTGKYLAPYLK